NHAGSVRFLAVDGSGSINVGPSGTASTVLGQTTTFNANGWNDFEIVFDRPNNLLTAKRGSTTLYSGPFPAGNYPTSGGFTAGFRENHSGGPNSANTEGTWIDDILIDPLPGPASVTDFQ